MKYITGNYALNIPCDLNTDGDWHRSALDWEHLPLFESDNSFFKDYGVKNDIDIYKYVPLKKFQGKKYNVANHIRALLDLLYQQNFGLAQGMKEDFIDNDKYTLEIFNKVSEMKKLSFWPHIDEFMGREYKMSWINYKNDEIGV